MSFLLDTNVVSEWAKPLPHPQVVRWLDEMDEDRVFLSVASVAEIRKGLELLADGDRRSRLAAWLNHDLLMRFDDRLLPIDRHIAETWGVLMATVQVTGRTISTMDGFFAATAAVHGLTLITRNVRDFLPFGIPVFNPWHPSST